MIIHHSAICHYSAPLSVYVQYCATEIQFCTTENHYILGCIFHSGGFARIGNSCGSLSRMPQYRILWHEPSLFTPPTSYHTSYPPLMHWEVADHPSEVYPKSDSESAEYRPFEVDTWEYSRRYLFGNNSTYYPPHEPQLGRLQTPWPWRWERNPPIGPPSFIDPQSETQVHPQSLPLPPPPPPPRRSVRVKSKPPTADPPVRHQSDIEPITPFSPTGGKSPSLRPKNFPTLE